MFPKSFILGFSSSRSFEPFIPRHLRHLPFVVQAASHFLPFSYTSRPVQVARNLASITADCHRCWRCRKTSLDSTETTLPSPSFILTLIIYARIPRETKIYIYSRLYGKFQLSNSLRHLCDYDGQLFDKLFEKEQR